jgi:hypothetical protein
MNSLGITMVSSRRRDIEEGKVGFVPYAEKLNGRLAMIGFAALILIEIFYGKGLFTLIGLKG